MCEGQTRSLLISSNRGHSSGLSWERENKKQTNKQNRVLMNRTRLSWRLQGIEKYGFNQGKVKGEPLTNEKRNLL